MFCLYCGKKLPDDAMFCSGCGKKLNKEEAGSANTEEAIKENEVTEGTEKNPSSIKPIEEAFSEIPDIDYAEDEPEEEFEDEIGDEEIDRLLYGDNTLQKEEAKPEEKLASEFEKDEIKESVIVKEEEFEDEEEKHIEEIYNIEEKVIVEGKTYQNPDKDSYWEYKEPQYEKIAFRLPKEDIIKIAGTLVIMAGMVVYLIYAIS